MLLHAFGQLWGGDRHRLLIRTDRAQRPGTSVHYRLSLPDGTSTRPLQVRVEACRAQDDLTYLVLGAADCTEELKPAPPVEAGRQFPRLPCNLAVVLPGQRIVALDFSRGGMQLEVEDRLEVGLEVELSLQDKPEKVACRAEVVWCRRTRTRGYRAGLRFSDLGEAARAALAACEDGALEVDRSEILRRFLLDRGLGMGAQVRAPAGPHEGQVSGYTVESEIAHVRLRRPDGQLQHYLFRELERLVDHGVTRPGRKTARLVRRPASNGLVRFIFVDERHKAVLEVVAASWTRRRLTAQRNGHSAGTASSQTGSKRS